MTPEEFNAAEIAAGRLTQAHVSELVKRFQASQGLEVDGKAGEKTRAALKPPTTELTIKDGWLSHGAEILPIHRSWYYPRLATGKPAAIVAHYTATDHGTARAMARHRVNPFRNGVDRAASWHVSIDGDGTIVQMVPFTCGAWHAGGKTAKPIAGLGPANRVSVGIELVGHGDRFPDPQILSARRVWRALVKTYRIEQRFAMVYHSELDPTRKKDPGPVFDRNYAENILIEAYR